MPTIDVSPMKDKSIPEPPATAGENAVEKDERAPVAFERSLLQGILGATALVSAALFYISWLYHRRYFEAFGLHATMVSFEARDYILNAKSALAINAIIIAFVVAARLFVDFGVKKIRRAVALFCAIGFLAGVVYLIRDLWRWGNVFGINIVGYRSAWVLILFGLVVLFYGAVAPTFIYKRLKRSSHYKRFASSVAWSSLLALGFLAISLTSNFVGYFEGKHDASIASRLPIVTVSTQRPIGVHIQPDLLRWEIDGSKTYFYFNLRLLAREGGIIYVLRPEEKTVAPLVHVVEMPDVSSFSLGWSTPITSAVTITSTPTLTATSPP